MEKSIVYMEYSFTVAPLQPASDILIAELGEQGFESFVETEDGVLAYINKEDWHAHILEGITILENPNFEIAHTHKEVEQENWNQVWESNFNPIQVEDRCVVRAPFHAPRPDVEFDIVIEPKMSFGTGHHETTHMMLQHVLEQDMQGLSVLDMGSGTGVLAILAALRGASEVDAVDIDNWCYLNAMENVERNQCENIRVREGDASILGDRQYDIILANINKNILLSDMEHYLKCLKKTGVLFVSGFYEEDIFDISAKTQQFGLQYSKKFEKNNWVAVKYVF